MKLLIALFVLLFLTTSSAQAASFRDSGGNLPVQNVCKPNAGYGGVYTYRTVDGKVRGRILMNVCKLRSMGAGPRDYRAVYQHELAHAHGKRHYQGTPETNKAYFPDYSICRC